MKLIDLTGMTFGRLTVLSRGANSPRGKLRWWCHCTCGKTALIGGSELRSGHTKSCGCWQAEVRSLVHTKHGQHGTDTWNSWCSMRRRCLDPNDPLFRWYGGRGITICDRWINSFDAFYEDMGPRPSLQHSLDRYPDQNGPYSPDNARWATSTEQARNRRSNHLLTFEGRTHCIAEWAELLHETLGLTDGAISLRLYRGWSIEQTLTTPLLPNGNMVTYQGVTQSVNAWAKHMHMQRATIQYRLDHGWTVEESLTTPAGQRRRAS